MDISTVLAAIWHDPPWKPWGIHASLSHGYTKITSRTGQGQRDYTSLILDALHRALNSEHAAQLLEEITSKNGKEVYAYVESFYRRIVEESGNASAGSHERQATVIPAVLAALLKASGDERLAGLSTILVEAGAKILRRDYRIRCADSLASAVDRSQLAKVAEGAATRELVLINPFDPSKKARLSPEIDAWRIAWFILNYTTAIARILKDSKTDADVERLLRDASFLLLEPIWYATMDSAYMQYMPPADTRLPTHTVFDHVNAALMTLLWCQGQGGARGYLAVVDLAGVQSWIRESRALRDLWASSWIASLLAWKAIEKLVEEYGPGVMVSPPARLTPFTSTRLILSRLQAPYTINVKIIIPKREHGTTVNDLKLYEVLGLSHGWPVDPVTPSRLLIALPPQVSEDKLRETVVKGVSKAWKTILDYALNHVRSLAEIIKKQGVERPEEVGVASSLVEAARDLEAPLAVRVYTVRIEDAFDEARRMSREYAEALYYGIALTMLKAMEDKIKVKLPGRRSGQAYYNYAAEAHKAWRGRKATCTVCGRAPAIVDGRKLREALEAGKVQDGIELSNIREDRLCPYCLTKRLLRTMLRDRKDKSRELVGIDMTPKARERLSFATIDAYTSRTALAKKELAGLVKELAGQLEQLGGSCTDGLPEILKGVADVRNRFIRDGNLHGNCIEEAESIILEVVHDKALLDKALEELSKKNANQTITSKIKSILKEAYRRASVYRSKYAILQMDVDFMGAGILSGRLGLRPEEHYRYYARWIANLEPEDTVNEFDKMYTEIANLLDKYERQKLKFPSSGGGDVKTRLRESTPTVVVTPSYHFAVSRSLAVQSLLDRRIIEGNGGMVIYAGGDDLLAILPPVDEGGDSYRYPALEAAWTARRTYWGEGTRAHQGFNAVYVGSSRGLVVGVAPALRAYGRSGALYIVDIAVPMWISLELAGELEESKDIIERRLIDCAVIKWYKDVLVIASDSSGAAILPFTRLEGGEVKLQDIQGSLAALLANIRIRGKGGKGISRSIFPDYTLSVDTVYMLVKHLPQDLELAEKYVVRIIGRNKEVEEIDEQGIHGKIVGHLGGGGAYTSLVCVSEDSIAGRLLASTGYGMQDCGRVCSQVVSQVFLTARILSGSL